MRFIKIFYCSAVLWLLTSFKATSQNQIPLSIKPTPDISISLLGSSNKVSIRGLSVVNDNIFWASGSGGMVAKSTDGGKNIEWTQVPGFEKRDFRDIEAFDQNTAIIMAVDQPAIILKTTDGGKNWKKVFEDTTTGMFLDAMHFEKVDGKLVGMVVGDPIKNKIFYAKTFDGGNLVSIAKNLELIPSSLYFQIDSGSQPLPPTTIFIDVVKSFLTGSVTFTSRSFDFFNNELSASQYAIPGGQYPGRLDDINNDIVHTYSIIAIGQSYR